MERRFAVHAGAHRQALIAIATIVLACPIAHAAPKDAQAKRLFDRGVAAYTKGDLAGAAAALSESYAREGDAETLFAWAQAERKQGHCAKAIELYNTLLAFELPAENQKVVQAQLAECKQLVAAKEKPAEPVPAPVPVKPEPQPAPEPTAAPPPASPPATPEGRAWWRDPIGDGLVAGGVVALGAGTMFLLSAHSADQAKSSATSYDQYKSDANTAHDRGVYGVVGLIAGGALVAGSVAWYATHSHRDASSISGWLAPGSGGIRITRVF